MSIIAFYEFENNGNDSSGNGYNLTNSGTPAYSSSIYKYGAYSFAANTSTATNFLVIPSGIETTIGNLSSGGYTIQFWVYNDANNIYSHFFSKQANANSTGSIMLSFNGTGGVYGECVQLKWNGSTDRILAIYDQSEEVNTWIRINLEYDIDNDRLKVYKNGNLVYTLNTAGEPFATNDGTIRYGTSNFAGADGEMDNCAFADTLYAGAEITLTTKVYNPFPKNGIFSTSLQNLRLR